jgi:hypothetical protein
VGNFFSKIKYYVFSVVTAACALLFIHPDSNAQEIRVDTITVATTRTIRIITTWTVPKFILQLSGGYNWGAMELSGHNGGFSRDDFMKGKSFGARNGYGIALTGKIPLHKTGHFWLDIISSFNRFQSNLIAKNTEEGKVSYNVFSGGIGFDYNFTPTHRVKYFFGANSLFSVIGGEAELITPGSSVSYKVKIIQSFRIGYSGFVGLEYAFDKNLGVNLGLKFTHANVLLKKSDVFPDSLQTGLNDNSTSSPQLYTAWKQFAYSSVFGGFSYYFGVRERRYKLP